MLDLTAQVNNAVYEVKMADGQILHLRRPTQAMYQTIMNLQDNTKDLGPTEQMNVIFDLFLRVINRNVEGIKYGEEVKDEYDLNICIYLLLDYFNETSKEIADKVNFQKAQ